VRYTLAGMKTIVVGAGLAGIRSVGKEHEADALVVATDAPTAGALTGEVVPEESVGGYACTTRSTGLDVERRYF